MGLVLSHWFEFCEVGKGATESRVSFVLGGEKQEKEKERPVFLMAVIDRSQSMKGENIQKAKKSLMLLLENTVSGCRVLGESDMFGIVLYSKEAEVILPPLYMDDAGRTRAKTAITNMKHSKGTNIEAGITLGLREMLKTQITDNSVYRALWLFTDGAVNAGITSADTMTEHVIRLNNNNIAISTFEYGNDCNDVMLRAISQSGGGSYHAIREKNTVEYFASAIGALFSVAAMDITITVQLKEGVLFSPNVLEEITVVSDANKKTLSADQRCLTLNINNIIIGQQLSFIVSMKLPPIIDQPDTKCILGTATIVYNSTSGRIEEETVNIEVSRVATPDVPADLNFVRAELTDMTSKAIIAASQMVSENNKSQALIGLEEGIRIVSLKRKQTKLLSAGSGSVDFCLDDLKAAKESVEKGEKAGKELRDLAETWTSQRSVGTGTTSFATRSQKDMQKSIQ
eukprot:TRINITY_DN17367_c0_g1_i1.p1 TRINITY_DN17367_c0_g1~~TRINITY_DN17367_c0_g1_i1.p1  ORF type:complete len:473 (+),score=111.25 TRINITY_DN17367_c0_g1_i1:51-1421(+)